MEGPQEKLENARVLVQNIVHDHKRMQESLMKVGLGEQNPFEGPHKSVPIQDVYSDAIIGVFGHSIKALFQRTGCFVFVPREMNSEGERVF